MPAAEIGHIGATIFGCEGPHLSKDELNFFRDANPAGFIIFARNIDNPDQVRGLVNEFKSVLGRDHLAVLIDQEGGRVQRLGPPNWPKFPPMGIFGEIYTKDAELAEAALRINIALLAAQLRVLGITVNCLPLLDVPVAGSDKIIGDRAFGSTPGQVAHLGGIVCKTLKGAGILPVLKHIPGHGRARVDSHKGLPVVSEPVDELIAGDFAPFKALSDELLAMTAHVTYTAIDPENPATLSQRVVSEFIRGHIGFSGLLMSDDLSMRALEGDFASRTKNTIAAGCDLALHCNGDMAEMTAVAENAGNIAETRYSLLDTALKKVAEAQETDLAALTVNYKAIMAKMTTAGEY